jgi:hypothetical protein
VVESNEVEREEMSKNNFHEEATNLWQRVRAAHDGDREWDKYLNLLGAAADGFRELEQAEKGKTAYGEPDRPAGDGE